MAGVVLVVDDENSVRDSFQLLLQREGYTVLTASCTKEAAVVLDHEHVDTIICDILLREGSGLALLVEVNARQLHVPVILITGAPNYESAALAVRQGAFDYLTKPVRKEQLLLILERALGHKALLDRKLRLEEENRQYRHNLEASVRQRTMELNKANAELQQEVEERRKAEAALASLNKDLERLVTIRTKELAEKNLELEASNRRLTELDAMKSAFLSLVSHELRTPMTSVLGFAKLIRKDFLRYYSPLGEANQLTATKGRRILDNLEVILREGHRLTRIISDVLDITRIEAGKVEWRNEHLAPEQLIQQVVTAMQGLFEQTPQVRLVAEAEPYLPTILADPDRLQQVLINLLSNAHKFTTQGHVRIGATMASDVSPPVVRFFVADTGAGIHPDDAEHIFDKFFQGRANDEGSEKPHGTGLGLVICRTIVEHYGGRLWMESTLGEGSTFYVELPADTPSPARS